MSPRDTKTGNVLEQMIQPALEHGGYHHPNDPSLPPRPAQVGQRLGTGRHYVDVLAAKQDRKFLISLKWQQSSGTAEQKVPFEVICLIEKMETGEFDGAYIVLAGDGWKPRLKRFYLEHGLDKYIRGAERVKILSLDAFIAKANQGQL